MIKSMTGYGRCEHIDENRKIVIDIRSVNSRYCDISVTVSYTHLDVYKRQFHDHFLGDAGHRMEQACFYHLCAGKPVYKRNVR